MRSSFLLLPLSLAATVFADSVPEGIAPSTPAPEGCEKTYDGNFTLGIAAAKRLVRRTEDTVQITNSAVTVTLKDGVLHDSVGRTGAIVSNYQFQFDGPPQAGSIYTGGFSVCQNMSLALGGSTIFYKCVSGEFYNLYDRNVAAQCEADNIVISPVNKPSSSSSSAAASSTVASSGSASSSAASASASTSASASLSASLSGARNGTVSTATPSASGSGSASITRAASAASEAASGASKAPSSTGAAALPTRVPRRETFGAVVGILGAALIL